MSPELVWLAEARRLGLALGCRDELRSGEPTWPKANVVDGGLLLWLSSSRFCRANRAP